MTENIQIQRRNENFIPNGMGSHEKILSKEGNVNVNVNVKPLSRVRLFVTTWTVAYQSPVSMGFSRQEYWSGLPFPSPEDLPDSGIEPGLQHCRQTLYHLSHQNHI